MVLARGSVSVVAIALTLGACGERPKSFHDPDDGKQITWAGKVHDSSPSHIGITLDDGRKAYMSTASGHWYAGIGDVVKVTGRYNSPCSPYGCSSQNELRQKSIKDGIKITWATPQIIESRMHDRHMGNLKDFGEGPSGEILFRYDRLLSHGNSRGGWSYKVRTEDTLTGVLGLFRAYSWANRFSPSFEDSFRLGKGTLQPLGYTAKLKVGETIYLIPQIPRR